MPIKESTYVPPFFLTNGHTQTLYPTFFRKIKPSFDYRVRLATPDKDFIDVDWKKNKSKKCVILSHGLEGDSKKWYISAMTKHFSDHKFDVCAWNFRGCSGETNKTLRTYHSGKTEDLDLVIQNAINDYTEIYLVGFSMGGNVSLKYVGERGENIHHKIKKCAVFSVPVDLYGSCVELNKKSNIVYMKMFISELKEKLEAKQKLFPNEVSLENYSNVKSFIDFDNMYTAPLNGFENSADYCKQASSKQFITTVKIPTLLVNAMNDPFLSESCYPINECRHHDFVTLEMPKEGGHISFAQNGGIYYSEQRALEFFLKQA